MPAARATLILLALAAAPAAAAVLDLESAERAAVEYSPAIKALQAAERTAVVESSGAWSVKDPELGLSYGQNDHGGQAGGEADPASDDYRASLRFFPPNPFEARSAGRAGEARVRLAEANVRQAARETALEVRRLYVQIQYLRRGAELANERLRRAEEHQDLVEQMRAGGGATSMDAAAVTIDYLDAVTLLGNLRADLAAAEADLAGRTCIDVSAGLVLSGGMRLPQVELETLEVDRVRRTAVENRPDVAVWTWTVLAMEADAQAARRSHWIWPAHVQASYGEERGFEDEQMWEVAAAFPLPVFSPGMTSDADVRRVQAEQSRAQLVAVRDQAGRRAERTLRRAVVAASHLKEMQIRTAPPEKELRDLLSATLDRPGVTVSALADLEKRLGQIEQARLDAEYGLAQAVIDLEDALGLDWDRIAPESP